MIGQVRIVASNLRVTMLKTFFGCLKSSVLDPIQKKQIYS